MPHRRFNHQMLLQIRLDLGLSQDEAAVALGVDARTLRRFESGAVNRGKGFSIRHPARRALLRRMCQEFGIASEEDWLLPEAPADPRPAPPIVTPALPRARHFTGRDALLRRLHEWDRDPASPHRVFCLFGIGGAGKTALAARFLADREGPPPVLHSFYEEPGIERFLRAALARCGVQAGSAGTTGQVEVLLSALSQTGVLLVLDGLEVAQSEGGPGTARALGELEDPVLRRLLRAVVVGLGATRLLCTSRFPLTDLAPWEGREALTLPLPGLCAEEGRALLRAWGVRGDESTLDRLVTEAGGHALSVAMTASYVGGFLGGQVEHLKEIPREAVAQDDPLARRLASILSAYAARLQARERDLLCLLSALPRGGDAALLSVLGEVAPGLSGLSEAEAQRLLRRLERLGLVAPAGAGCTCHPFLREHFRGLLGGGEAAVHELARRRIAARLLGRPAGYPCEEQALELHEALLQHTLLAGRPRDALALYERALGGFAHVGLRLGEMARGARLMGLFFPRGALESGDERLGALERGLLVYDLGLYLSALGDLAQAERCYQAHLALAREGGVGQAVGRRTLAYNTWLRGDLRRALRLLDEAVADDEGVEQRLRAVALRGAVLDDLGDAAGAAGCFAEARALEVGPPQARRALWAAEHHLGQGRIDEAEGLARSSQSGSAARGWAALIAHARCVLGACALARGDQAAAQEHAEAARAWAQRSGEVEGALRSSVLETRLLVAAGRYQEAAREAAAGAGLARVHGFVRFAARLESIGPGINVDEGIRTVGSRAAPRP